MRFAARIYRALLACYPAKFRRALGPALVRDFQRGIQERHGFGAGTGFAIRQLADVLANLPGAWRDARRDRTTQVPNGLLTTGMGQDLKYALRSVRTRPGFALVVVLTLALGIGANAAVFGVLDGVLLEPLPYRDANELVYMYESYKVDQTRSVSYLNYRDWRARNHTFQDVAARTAWFFTLTGQGQAEVLNGLIASANLLPLLGVEPVLGRVFTEDEELRESRVMLLSHGLWARRFGSDPGVVGRTLTLDDEPWTVVGVLPPELEFPIRADIYAPLTTLSDADQNSRGSRPGISAIARLRNGTTLHAAQRDMDAVAAGLAVEYPGPNSEAGVVVRSLRERYLGAAPPVLTPLIGAVVLVFLIACANVANLFLVRGQTRRREAAVRSALGGSRGRIVRVYLTEAGLLAGAGAVLGVLLARGGIALLRQLSATGIPRLARAEVDTTVLLFTVTMSALATLLVGVLPALRLSSVDPARELVDGGTRGSTVGGRRLRAGLVVLEVSLSFVLLAGSGLMLRSMANLMKRDAGFDPAHVLAVGVPVPQSRYATVEERARFFDRLVERVSAIPGVTSVAGGDPLPMGGNSRQMRTQAAEPNAVGEDGLRTDWYSVTPGYFATMKIPLLQGTGFDSPESLETPHVVVDRSFAERFWPGESAVGHQVRFSSSWSPWFTVVGVVEHVNVYGPRTEGREQIYVPHSFRMWGQNLVIRSQRDPASLTSAVRAVVSDVDPQVPLRGVATLESLVDGAVAAESLATRALSLFGAAALGLAMLGLYGVVSYSVSLRTREIGIRMALGDRTSGVVRSIAGRGLALASLGIALGFAGAITTTRLLEALLFGVEPADSAILASVAVALLAVSAMAAFIPALRAGRLDPAMTLRTE